MMRASHTESATSVRVKAEEKDCQFQSDHISLSALPPFLPDLRTYCCTHCLEYSELRIVEKVEERIHSEDQEVLPGALS